MDDKRIGQSISGFRMLQAYAAAFCGYFPDFEHAESMLMKSTPPEKTGPTLLEEITNPDVKQKDQTNE